MKARSLIIALILALLGAGTARAVPLDWTTFDFELYEGSGSDPLDPGQPLVVTPGMVLAVRGTLYNTDLNSDWYLNSLQVSDPPVDWLLDDSPYYSLDFPYPLTAGSTVETDLFYLTVGNTTGLYTFDVTFVGGGPWGEPDDQAYYKTHSFSVNQVPEPSVLLLLAAGVVAGGWRRARRLRGGGSLPTAGA